MSEKGRFRLRTINKVTFASLAHAHSSIDLHMHFAVYGPATLLPRAYAFGAIDAIGAGTHLLRVSTTDQSNTKLAASIARSVTCFAAVVPTLCDAFCVLDLYFCDVWEAAPGFG